MEYTIGSCGKREEEGMMKDDRWEDLLAMKKMDDILNRKDDHKTNPLLWILAVIGVIACVAAVAYGVYRFMTPDYFEDYDDDFDDDYESEDAEEEEAAREAVKEEKAKAEKEQEEDSIPVE
jgi:hypothetical protein